MKRLFPSLPANAGLAEVFQAHPDTIAPLLDYHDRLLRAPGELDIAARELIAAYVSGLNACQFCYGAHVIHAKAWGIAPETVEALLADPATAPVEEKLKPILAYVAKLTQSPAMMTEADAQAVYDAGWSEAALFTAVQTCALFNFMNRILEGCGVGSYPEAVDAVDADGLAQRRSLTSYTAFGQRIGVMG
ncbi:MAG: carboxymuconolactone decarboxylase family protein [Pseudomonadota bacterium]